MASTTPPAGWGVLEYAESRAREALAKWDAPRTGGSYLSDAMRLAETMRQLLAELDAERAARRD